MGDKPSSPLGCIAWHAWLAKNPAKRQGGGARHEPIRSRDQLPGQSIALCLFEPEPAYQDRAVSAVRDSFSLMSAVRDKKAHGTALGCTGGFQLPWLVATCLAALPL